ncbi:MAG: sugar ABC transporter permease [Planctomycetes bacterium]|nr:sugar ABC transporter permease [Planctomycetota bacterium]
MARRSNNLLAGLLWTAPWWLGFLLLLALPLAFSLYISFCDYPMLQPPLWVGGANYAELVHDGVFHKTISNTAVFAAVSVPLTTVVAIGLALLLNLSVKGQAFFRACIFVPTIVPMVAAGAIWMWMLNPDFGPIANLMRAMGVDRPPLWLDSPDWAMGALVLVSLWFVGSPVVIYLAGLQEIPEELYEAARMDGASAPRRFWHVTLPSLSPVVLFNVIISVIGAWQVFALPYMMWRTRPGPDRATYFYSMYLFDNAFNYLKMGYASALAWIQLLIILVLTGLVFLVSRRMVHYRAA